MAEALEITIGKILRARGLTLATAESCTGGLVSDRITNIPGSSDYFVGGIVAYSNQAKMDLLGVSRETLDAHGAVSQATVLEMARGARRVLKANLAVSVSGIAGPAGERDEKPLGTTWIAVVTPDGEWTRNFQWQGDRLGNKASSAEAALKLVLEALGGEKGL